ncbi:hypothetical protein EHQ43_14280 [Leptospira bouyouniensis]|uniref:Glycosyltransferase family 2 protein n=2 Tax=Leptospira bouyouniensis TaxID=2484911 RepID=A0A7I0HR41_9LEPT|nr:hypothetical protein EHQ43_14280 [Leptospira bouyouniensis]
MKLPVLLIAFNRPHLTSVVLDSIMSYEPSVLYIAVDGPRHEMDNIAINEFKEILSKRNFNFKLVTLFRKENLGCRLAVSRAIDWFFEHEDMGIILEDDCLPNKSFYRFMELMLIKYNKNENIGIISGNNFFYNKVHLPYSYYSTVYTHIWGWGTWKRAWLGYQSSGISEERIEEIVNSKFPNKVERCFWIENVKLANSGKLDTWDLQWGFFNWEKNRINIMPCKNLVKNIGFGFDATHTKVENSKLNQIETNELDFPLIDPPNLIPNPLLEYYTRRIFVKISFLERIKNYILSKMEKII